MTSPDLPVHGTEAAIAALQKGRPSLLSATLVADTMTPLGAALALMQHGRGDWFLESVEGGETRGRYSMLGIDPDLALIADADGVRLHRDWRTDRALSEPVADDMLTALRAQVASCRCDALPDLPPVLATLVGYLGFEVLGSVEAVPRASGAGLGLPDLFFVRAGVILVFDRLADTVTLVAPVWPEVAAAQGSDQAIAAAAERLRMAAIRLGEAPTPLTPALAAPSTPAAEAVVAPDHYAAMVAEAQALITAGDIFQVVLAQRFSLPFPLPPMALYRALRRENPSPYLYFLDFPDFSLIGSSPEILVRRRAGKVTIRPIAGTRPRGRDEATDRANETALVNDAKERAEHLMLLDLGRNDATRVSKPGTVRVTEQFAVERYSHVMHLVSNVEGEALDDDDPVTTLLAGFPAGTVSGAPKIRACEIIAALEVEPRGPYGGGVGYFGADGSMDSCIVLRTAVLKDGMMHVQAGAGIVADSSPEAEAAECRAKAGALFAAAATALAAAGLADAPGEGDGA